MEELILILLYPRAFSMSDRRMGRNDGWVKRVMNQRDYSGGGEKTLRNELSLADMEGGRERANGAAGK